jgi:hypothetical protein
MNLAEHVLAIVRDADKIALPIALAAAAGLGADWMYPDLFKGLPVWVLPTLRLVCIFSFVLGITGPLARGIGALWRMVIKMAYEVSAPLSRRFLEGKITRADAISKYQLLWCLASTSRRFEAPADHPSIIWMLDNGIVARSGMAWIGRLTAYEVTDPAWRTLLNMRDFLVRDHYRTAR